jgi:hypothetical protein
MSSKSTVLYTDRDRQIHEALRLVPLDTQQLLRLSETFERPFTSARKVRERMQQHQAAGWTTTYTYATTGPGQLNYYRLTRAGYQLLSGPRAVLPKRSFFAEVSPALQRHTRHLADVIMHTNVAAYRLGVRILDQLGDSQLVLTLGERSQKPDYSFRLATRDGIYTYYDELDESTEPVASTRQRESLEAKIRFHEDYQNATGQRYRVRMIFARASVRMYQFLKLARQNATRQRAIFYAVLLDDYLKSPQPLTSPLFLDHFNRLRPLLPASASREQMQLPAVAEMLAEPVGVC